MLTGILWLILRCSAIRCHLHQYAYISRCVLNGVMSLESRTVQQQLVGLGCCGR